MTFALTAAVDGITAGTVTSDLPGIGCLTDCAQHYGAGRTVTLTATPVAGQAFLGWGEDCAAAGASPSCTLAMSAARQARAAFGPPPPPAVVVPPAPPPPAPAPAPPRPAAVRLTSLHLSTRTLLLARTASRRLHRRARRSTATRVRFVLTTPARLTITLQAGKPGTLSGSTCTAPRAGAGGARCLRYVPLTGRRVLALPAGITTLTLRAIWHGRRLGPGPKRLSLALLDGAGNRVGPITARFSVAR